MTIGYAIFILVLAGLGLYTYSSIHFLISSIWVRGAYAFLSLASFVALLILFSYEYELRRLVEEKPWLSVLFFLLLGFLFMQILWSAVVLIDDVRACLTWIVRKCVVKLSSSSNSFSLDAHDVRISRSTFLQWMGFGLGSFLFGLLIFGMTNKYNYKKRKIQITLKGLSKAWKGYKIVQISDVHSGSFRWEDREEVKKGIDIINEEQPNVVFFTGDLVNNISKEFEKWQEIFCGINAPVYSVLGNHDYGDYYKWASEDDKKKNLQELISTQKTMGWILLNNESIELEKEGASDKLTLVGVENWSAKSQFPKYGDLNKALSMASPDSVKILMSHDPSHWDAEVVNIHPSIKLTLSGHTHGMQFGLETPFFSWSPVQWVYKQWAGLYQKDDQMLYVNRGFGFLGYPGRVGIMPEITVIELI